MILVYSLNFARKLRIVTGSANDAAKIQIGLSNVKLLSLYKQ